MEEGTIEERLKIRAEREINEVLNPLFGQVVRAANRVCVPGTITIAWREGEVVIPWVELCKKMQDFLREAYLPAAIEQKRNELMQAFDKASKLPVPCQ